MRTETGADPTRLVPTVSSYPFADLDLADAWSASKAEPTRPLSRRARRSCQPRRNVDPGGRACAMFDGVGSPLTQTFGLGMFEPHV